MNILFFTSFKVSPTKGGTERTTISVATGLKKYYGCHCYSSFMVNDDSPMDSCFDAEFYWVGKKDSKTLQEFLQRHNIDWIINQGAFYLMPIFSQVINGTCCKVAFVHHFQPGWEEHFLTFSKMKENFLKSLTSFQYVKQGIKLLLYPWFRYRYLKRLPSEYRIAYQLADRVVLLCDGFISEFKKYGKFTDDSKFVIVPNGLSYDEYLPESLIEQKKPIALIVSRLDDPPKRLSLALRIWKEVKKYPESQGWILNIVGHGPYEKQYREMIKQLNLPDVYLLGRQQPKPYYEESSIFLMTSKSEGWGLTLTEAQQFGVVPIAFDSYAALKDIIIDGEDGISVPECNVEQYVEKLLQLMSNKDRREQMARNGLESCRRYSQEEIAKKWWKILYN